jgi:magnesium transporter
MRAATLTASNLHDPVLPLVRPVPVVLRATHTVSDAHTAIRAVPQASGSSYFYVLDDGDRLAGVVSARHLLAGKLDQRVDELMIAGVIAIPHWATVLVASEYFATRRLKAFPVIHDDGTLAGVVDVGVFSNQIISVARETYDEIFQLLGVHATAMSSPWTSYRDRFPWLLSNISGGLLCAFIASRFEELLQQVVVLALFIPVVLALAESVSMQSATLTLQSLSEESLRPRRVLAALWREVRTGALLGISASALVALAVLAWRRDAMGALVIAGAISAAILAACVFGVLLPTIIRAGKADPRIASGPLVLASTDLVTLVAYLWLGLVVLGR